MKAAICYGDSVVKYEEIKEPSLKSSEVKVNVKACGICGSDIPRALKNSAHSYPIVLGHECSGVISEIGENVEGLKVGDKVTIAPLIPCGECEQCRKGNYSLCPNYSFVGSRQQGAMAEYVVVPKENVYKLSDSITFEQGALFEPSTVALHALYQNNYKPNGYVAVIGGGTIGVFALQWAKILGCKKVVVFGRDKKHLELATKLGADFVISTLDENFYEQAMTQTEGKGFDYVFETAGSTTTIKYAFQLGAKKSHICMVGTPTSELTFSVKEWEQLNRKEFYLTGSWMSYSAPFPGKEWEMTEKYFANGELKFVDEMFFKKFLLSQAQDAFNLFADKNIKVKGRVLLKI
ncbi:galactitol-1-phosphate 5-dehydrogenase [bacterium]|nr:galactitol-1-phosphate 5-dehydrogenase [bacterium]